ncbi:hypothetical protein V7182_20785 [Neobacillus drentensis]|uniref:hypothetical protein n=1 Tax=Neobacillus drentensis TaxID=220684 RepID=UPI002FFF0D53
MTSILWAFITMLVLMLILFIIPLRLTVKGKLLIALKSFLFAISGLFLVALFPLWETALILLTLIFLAAYFMVTRMRKLILNNHPVLVAELNNESINKVNLHERTINENTSLESKELNKGFSKPTINFEEELKIQNIPYKDNLIDADISFLLERNFENEADVQLETPEKEKSSLSELESLLVEKTIEKGDHSNLYWLDDMDDLLELQDFTMGKFLVTKEKKELFQK